MSVAGRPTWIPTNYCSAWPRRRADAAAPERGRFDPPRVAGVRLRHRRGPAAPAGTASRSRRRDRLCGRPRPSLPRRRLRRVRRASAARSISPSCSARRRSPGPAASSRCSASSSSSFSPSTAAGSAPAHGSPAARPPRHRLRRGSLAAPPPRGDVRVARGRRRRHRGRLRDAGRGDGALRLVSEPVALVAATAIAGAALASRFAGVPSSSRGSASSVRSARRPCSQSDGGVTATGTGFAAVMTAAAAAVGVRMRWRWLLAVAGVTQRAAGRASRARRAAAVTPVRSRSRASSCSSTSQPGSRSSSRRATTPLVPLPTMFVLGSIGVTWLAGGAAVRPRGQRERRSRAPRAAAGFAAATVGRLAPRPARARDAARHDRARGRRGRCRRRSDRRDARVHFAAEAAVSPSPGRVSASRAFCSERSRISVSRSCTRSPSTRRPSALVQAARHPASGAGALASAAAAALVVGWVARTEWHMSLERGVLRSIAPVVAGLRARAEELRLVSWALAALLAVDAVSLLVLELFETVWPHGGIVASFHRGQVAVTGVYAVGGLAAALVASGRRAVTARRSLFAWLALAALKTRRVRRNAARRARLLARVPLARGRAAPGRLRRRPARAAAAFATETRRAIAVAIVFAVAATHPIDGEPARGMALLRSPSSCSRSRPRSSEIAPLPRPVDAALGAGTRASRRRERPAPPRRVLTLAWAGGAAALAGLAVTLREKRLQVASFGYLVLTAGAAFHEAPPSQLVVAHVHPAHGIVGVLLLSPRRSRWRGGGVTGRPQPATRRYAAIAGWLDERQKHWRSAASLGGGSERRLYGLARHPRAVRPYLVREPAHRLPARPQRGERALGRARTCLAVRRA